MCHPPSTKRRTSEPTSHREPSGRTALFRLRVLGPVTIRHDADPVSSSRVSQPRQLALLCYLALARPRGLHSRDTLIDLLWPNHDGPRGRQALRNALHGLRRLLGNSAIVASGAHLVGMNTALISCDAADLERGVRPTSDDAPASDDAEPLTGLYVDRAPAFDGWLSNERARLRALLAHAQRSAPPTPGAASAAQPYSPDAWVMHARGHYLFLRTAHGGSAEDLLRCRDYFERALRLDPAFAPAVAGLANFYAVAGRRGVLCPFHEHFAHAIRLSEQALALDDTLAVPHVHFGVKALYLDDDWDRAGAEFETAVAKDPSYAEGRRFFAVWLGLVGRHAEALRQVEQAVALEPDIAHFLSSLAAARLAAGDRAGAEDALRRTLLLEPRHAAARERLVRLLDEDGRHESAVEERERSPAVADARDWRAAFEAGPDAYADMARAALQREADALEARLLDGQPEAVNDIFSPPVVRLVSLHARLGNWKRARSWQVQARARRPALGRWFSSLPELGAVDTLKTPAR